jgi:hypothetical protein
MISKPEFFTGLLIAVGVLGAFVAFVGKNPLLFMGAMVIVAAGFALNVKD